MAEFPKEFVWGAATAAYQIEGGATEGGKGLSIWDVFSHTPGCTYRGETGDVACDSYHRWKEDLALLQSMHLKAYRFSVAWTRIAPNGGTDWNEEGFAYYDTLVDALLEAGIEPYVTLYHWDLPQALEEKGGWRSEETARAFASYAAKMAEHFKGRVHQWFTFNEPACIVKMGYGTGEHAPGLKLPLEGQFTCWRNVIYAHCLAAQELRHADPENKVGFVSTGRICYPVSEAKTDVDAARVLTFACPDDDWAFTHTMALDPVCLGRWPEPDICGPRLAASIAAVPQYINDALPLGKPDMVGLNIYNAAPAQMGENGPSYVERPAGYAHTAMNWPVEPECLNWGPRQMQERYGLPMFITENGLSCTDKVYRDGKVHDADRIDFLARYLEKLSEGIHAGADVRGYFQWSLLDNFEWHSGYRLHVGDLFFDLSADRKDLRAFRIGDLPHRLHKGQLALVRAHVAVGDIGRVDHRLIRQKEPAVDDLFFLVRHGEGAGGLALFQMRFDSLYQFQFFGIGFIHLCLFSDLGNSSVQNLDIREDQLQVNCLNISCRINGTIHMNDIRVLEAAYHMNNGVYLTDICQKLVSQPFTFASPFYKSCNVNNFYSSGNDTSRMNQFGKFGQAFIRNGDDTYIRFDGTEREVGCLSLCIR